MAPVEARERRQLKAVPVPAGVKEKMFQEAMAAWSEHLLTDRWAKFFDEYDPLATARRIHTPVLILQGNEDVSCPPANADALAAALRTSGNADVTVRHLLGVDHAFLRVRDFQQGVAYGERAYLLSSDVLGDIVSWTVPRLR